MLKPGCVVPGMQVSLRDVRIENVATESLFCTSSILRILRQYTSPPKPPRGCYDSGGMAKAPGAFTVVCF